MSETQRKQIDVTITVSFDNKVLKSKLTNPPSESPSTNTKPLQIQRIVPSSQTEGSILLRYVPREG
jgi:hypothetical protein